MAEALDAAETLRSIVTGSPKAKRRDASFGKVFPMLSAFSSYKPSGTIFNIRRWAGLTELSPGGPVVCLL
jgi:hypothetical protein